MAGPKPDVNYTPYATTEASGGGGTPMSVRATPDDFGAQVGGAVEGAGQAAFGVAIKQQGMINETLATNTETQYMRQLGKLTGQYKSLSGLEAVDATDKYNSDVVALRQQMRGDLPTAAAKAFDTLAIRREGYALMDSEGYRASQIKKAQMDSGVSLVSASSMAAGAPDVAANDTRFGEHLGDIKNGIQLQMDENMPGLKKDPTTGAINFDTSTPEGQAAKTNYKNSVDYATGIAWENRFKTLASQDPVAAQKKFEDEKGNIPAASAVRIQASLDPMVQDHHVTTSTALTMNQAGIDHQDALTNPPKQISDVADAIHAQESGGKANSITSVDGAVGGWQITPATFAQYAKPGEDIKNPADNEAVGRRIVDDLKQKYPNDPARVATAYFSGQGNVAPPGSPTPWLHDATDGNGKSVSSYVSDVTGRMGGAQTPAQAGKDYATNANGSPVTLPDYYASHKDQIIANGDAYADKTMPGNLEFKNMVRQRLTNQMDNAISSQKAAYKQDNTFIQKGITGALNNGTPPATYQELRALPGMADVLDRAAVQDPEFSKNIDTSIQKMQKVNNETNSPNFYYNVQRVLQPEGTANRIGTENELNGIMARTDGNNINAKDYMDAKKALDYPDTWKSFLSQQMKTVSEANGNADGLGEQRATQFYQYANKMRDDKLAKGAKEADLVDPDSKDYVGGAAPLYAASREKQISNVAGNMRKVASVATVPPRQPGEGLEQYLTRTGI